MLSRKKSNSLVGTLLVLGDAITVYLGLVMAYWVRFQLPHPLGKPELSEYMKYFVLMTVIILFVYRHFGLYNRQWSLVSSSEVARITKATAGGVVAVMVPAFMFKNVFQYSTFHAVISFFIIALLLLLYRKLFGRFEIWFFCTRGLNKRLVVVGSDEKAAHLIENINNAPQLCYEVVGVLAAGGEKIEEVAGVKVIGEIDKLEQLLKKKEVDEVILTVPGLEHSVKQQMILHCERELINFRMVPDVYEVLTSNVEVVNIDGVPLLGIKGIPFDSPFNRIVKRAMDLVVSFIGLICCAPFLLLLSIIIKLNSKGPVFYKQIRAGEDGMEFNIYKIRTMRSDAESGSGPQMTAKNDQRVTGIGRLMRKYDIDEVPQLYNVLIGQMSLVGPRPERPHFVNQFKNDIKRYMSRHQVKTGMTGWAQVHGLRQNTSFEERTKYDLYYIENWSLWLDLKILLMTFFKKTRSYSSDGGSS
jgi:exopolysaccharide biosynthesis polyprenyl glycosylphosphotransferase